MFTRSVAFLLVSFFFFGNVVQAADYSKSFAQSKVVKAPYNSKLIHDRDSQRIFMLQTAKDHQLNVFDQDLNLKQSITLPNIKVESSYYDSFELLFSKENPNFVVYRHVTPSGPYGSSVHFQIRIVDLSKAVVSLSLDYYEYSVSTKMFQNKLLVRQYRYPVIFSVYDMATGKLEKQDQYKHKNGSSDLGIAPDFITDEKTNRISVITQETPNEYVAKYDAVVYDFHSHKETYRFSRGPNRFAADLNGRSVWVEEADDKKIVIRDRTTFDVISTHTIVRKNADSIKTSVRLYFGMIRVQDVSTYDNGSGKITFYDAITGTRISEIDCSNHMCTASEPFIEPADQKVKLLVKYMKSDVSALYDVASGKTDYTFNSKLLSNLYYPEYMGFGFYTAIRSNSNPDDMTVLINVKKSATEYYIEGRPNFAPLSALILSENIFVRSAVPGELSLYERLPEMITVNCGAKKAPAVGAICLGGGVYAGEYKGHRYMMTPSNCRYQGSNYCDYTTDDLLQGWGAKGVATGAHDLEDGEKNAEKLRYSYSASAYCQQWVYGGFEDWYLPAINELKAFYDRKNEIGGFSKSAPYWSSTEFKDPNNLGFDKNLSQIVWTDGRITNWDKGSLAAIRCVRKIK